MRNSTDAEKESDSSETTDTTKNKMTNRVLTLESKLEDCLQHIQVERQGIDSVELELNNLDKTVQKAQPDIKNSIPGKSASIIILM